MTGHSWATLALFLGLLLALAWPLGLWMARIAEAKPTNAVERGLYRMAGVDPAPGSRLT